MKIRARKFKEFLMLAKKQWNEPCLRMNDKGLSTVTVDPAHVSMLSAIIKPSDDCIPDDKEREFCIDADKLVRFLLNYSPSDMLNVELSDEQMTVTDGKMTFKLALLTPEAWPKFPDLESKLTSGGEFNVLDLKAIYDCHFDNLAFKIEDEILIAEANNENDNIVVKGEIGGKAQARSLYPTEYVNNALIGEKIYVKFATDLPCLLIPQLENIEARIMLAPRIEND